MDGMTIVWIIIAIIVVIALFGLFVSQSRKRQAEAHREEAADLRATAAEHDREHREREAAAAEAQAQADKARAEAQEQQARAQRLEAEAERRGEAAAEARDTRDEHLRQADVTDPDVEVDEAAGAREGGIREEDGRGRHERLDGTEAPDAQRDPWDGSGQRVDDQADGSHGAGVDGGRDGVGDATTRRNEGHSSPDRA